MSPAQDSEGNSLFPMAIACTGCATKYRIDGPRGFTCPHCGNHIQILNDGKVEIIPKATMAREVEQLEEPPGSEAAESDVIRNRQQELEKLESMDRVEHGTPNDEPVLEINIGKKPQAGASAPRVDEPPPPMEDEPESDISDAEIIDEGAEEQRALDEQIRIEEARLEKLRKGRELLEQKKREATMGVPLAPPPMKTTPPPPPPPPTGPSTPPPSEPSISASSPFVHSTHDHPQPVAAIPSSIPATEPPTSIPMETPMPNAITPSQEPARGKIPPLKERKELTTPIISGNREVRRKPISLPFDGDPKKNALLAIGVVMILVLAGIIISLNFNEDFTVRMPSERMGDEGKYRVDGEIRVSSPDGISTRNGIIQDLRINLDGQLWYTLNGTNETVDGFGITHTTLDTFLFQDLDLSGSVELLGSKTTIDDAGKLRTKSSTYTSLITNKTVQTRVYNDLDLNILSYYTLRSTDHGIYYPSSEGGDYNLLSLGDREFSLGDTGDMAGGQFKWKAEKKEKVYKWDCIKLHITENNSGSQWRDFSGDIWVANECSLPVKIHVQTRVDSTKLSPAQRVLFSLFSSTDGFLDIDYIATMFLYKRGNDKIPWDHFGDDPSVTERNNVQFDAEWVYAPLIGNDTISFDKDFSPEAAAEYAIPGSSELRSFVNRHEDEVYIVDGSYSVVNGTQYWQLLFGYRESGISVNSRAHNITISKKGSTMDVFSDPGEETIANPSNSREEVERAMNIADSEDIFGEMTYLRPLFIGDTITFEDSTSGDISFNIQNNYLHTGLTLSSSFNPLLQNTIPAGYGYYLGRERTKGDEYYLEEGMIDAQNGKVIYELDHYQSGQF